MPPCVNVYIFKCSLEDNSKMNFKAKKSRKVWTGLIRDQWQALVTRAIKFWVQQNAGNMGGQKLLASQDGPSSTKLIEQ
jgi:hypothetical protein